MTKLSKNDEVEIVIAYLGGVPIKDICEYYGIHRGSVHRVITRQGFDTDRGKRSVS